MLIKDPKERQQRAERNREMLWDFLMIHTYSDLDTLAHHIDAKTKPVASRILSKWIYDGLVKKEKIQNKFGYWWLFGITTKALAGEVEKKAFQPSKVNLRTLEHTLKCQRTSSYFLKHHSVTERGYKMVNIETGDLEKYALTHRPDLIIQNQNNSLVGLVCIEVELSLKSKQRYTEIFRTYIRNIQSQKINQVIYVFYDESLKNRFETNILKPFLAKDGVEREHAKKIFVELFD